MNEIIKVESAEIIAADPLQRVADMVLNTVDIRSQRDYRRALLSSGDVLGFLPWLAQQSTGLTRMTVNAYVAYLKQSGVPDSSINQRMAAVRKLAVESADNGYLDHSIASTIKSIKNIQIRGKKLGNWLGMGRK